MERGVAIAEMAGAPTPTALLEHRSMTDYSLTGENPTDLPKRAVRALTERMTVLPDFGRVKGAEDLYLVVSGSGSEYLVDSREGRCNCPDAQHNLDAEEQCKHERRVGYATGEMSLPGWVNTNAVDSQLGMHTNSNPLHAITDGGITVEDAEAVVGDTKEEREECDDCSKLSDDFPCWPCVRDGKRELPE